MLNTCATSRDTTYAKHIFKCNDTASISLLTENHNYIYDRFYVNHNRIINEILYTSSL